MKRKTKSRFFFFPLASFLWYQEQGNQSLLLWKSRLVPSTEKFSSEICSKQGGKPQTNLFFFKLLPQIVVLGSKPLGTTVVNSAFRGQLNEFQELLRTWSLKLGCPISFFLTGIYVFKFNRGNTIIMRDIVLVSLLLNLNKFHTLFWCFHCWFGTSKGCVCSHEAGNPKGVHKVLKF